VKVVVAFAPGGAADLFARMLAAEMSSTFKQQFYVENVAGKPFPSEHWTVRGTGQIDKKPL